MDYFDKLSHGARALMTGQRNDRDCRVNVLFEKSLARDAVEAMLARIETLGACELELRPRMAFVSAMVPVSALGRMAAMEEVEWIDVETVVSVESLLD